MSFGLTNFYEHIKSDNSLRNYPNEDKINITLPARMLILGPSGSGKSNIHMNIVKNIRIFDKVVLLSKNLDEPLYKLLANAYHKIERKHKVKIFLAIDNIKDLPAIEDFNPNENSLLIVDDFICEKPILLKKVEEFWIRGRKHGITMAFLSQGYFDTPKMIRKNSNYIMIKKIGNPKDLKRILSEYQLDVTAPQIESMYKQALSRGKLTDFFMIDLATHDHSLKFRSGFG